MIEMYIRAPQFLTELLKLSLFPDTENLPNTHTHTHTHVHIHMCTRVYTYTVTGTRSQNQRKEPLGSLLSR